MLDKKPYFTLNIDAHMCLAFIQFNGQFIFGAEMMPMKLDMPLNHWIRKGDNQISIALMPVDDEGEMGSFATGSRVEATLNVRQAGGSKEDNVRITSLRFDSTDPDNLPPAERLGSKKGFKADPKGDVKVGKTRKESYQDIGVVMTRTVTLPKLGLPEWKFFKSDDLTDMSGFDIEGRVGDEKLLELQDELLPIYKGIWDALDKGDVDSILPLYEERSAETDAAFFKEPGETQASVERWLRESVSDPNQKLWPISEDNVMIRLYDNNKLAQLVQNNDNPLLSFDYTEGGARHYEAIFRKSGKDWILTR